MKNLIFCISMFFVIASCKNNAEDKVATQFKSYVNFVDSIEKFNAVYKTTGDTIVSIPTMTKDDTIVIAHKSLFENSSKFGTDIISNYMIKSAIIDSMDRVNCFTQEQRNEIKTTKKKFDKMVADGALGN